MAIDLFSAVNEYLDSKDADGFLYSGPINRNNADQMVKLIDSRRNRRKNVCLFVATFGGDPNAAYRIGRAFKANYGGGSILAVIGGYCKSAGTLLALSANELAFGCFGELGPLDTQIGKPNEILGAESGLDLLQALDQISASSFKSFEQQMIDIVRQSGGAITTKVAAEIASSLTVGIFSPISGQVDPLRLGVVKRAIDIAQSYGNRLKSDNVRKNTVEKLVTDYPAHGFVIDQNEAKDLFEKVRSFNLDEIRIFEALDSILRVPAPEGEEFISDLLTDFTISAVEPEVPGDAADQNTMGAVDEEPEND
jgi:hypothetical protein